MDSDLSFDFNYRYAWNDPEYSDASRLDEAGEDAYAGQRRVCLKSEHLAGVYDLVHAP